MKKVILYCLWGFFYIMCWLLGNITGPSASQAAALTVLSVVFFLPPLLLLVDGLKTRDQKTLLILRLTSIASLSLTMILFIVNILSVNGSETLGNILHQVLNFVSVPMFCSQHYVLSMFLWACLLFATLPGVILKKK